MNTTIPVRELTFEETIDDLLGSLEDMLEENQTKAKLPRLSFYLPVGKTDSEAEKGRIMLRNFVVEAIEQLQKADLLTDSLRSGLEKLHNLTDRQNGDESFWRFQEPGLAIFLDGENCRIGKVNKPFTPRLAISGYWHLTPMLSLAANVDAYWLLKLSLNEVEL